MTCDGRPGRRPPALAALVAGLALLTATTTLAAEKRGEIVYFGTRNAGAGQGIVAARLDPRDGALTPLGLVAQVDKPMWIAPAPQRGVLYAVDETGNGPTSSSKVTTFQVDATTGKLKPLGAVATGGVGATYLSMTQRNTKLLVAHFGSGQVSALPIQTDGTLGAAASIQADVGTGPHPRQTSPHAHAVEADPSGRFALVPDLGADRLFVYRLDKAGQLTPGEPPFEQTSPGTGPRQVLFHPNGKLVFMLSELKPELRAYRWDGRAGRLQLLSTTPTAPPATGVSGAAVTASRDGRFLYVSNRGEDTLVTYAVDGRTGGLREVQRIASGGKLPWAFALDHGDRWLVVANQGSATIAVFKRDARTGKLTQAPASLATPNPIAVAIYSG